MLDAAGILISTLLVLYVVIQAVRQDAKRPWFEVPEKAPEASPTRDAGRPVPPWRRPR